MRHRTTTRAAWARLGYTPADVDELERLARGPLPAPIAGGAGDEPPADPSGEDPAGDPAGEGEEPIDPEVDQHLEDPGRAAIREERQARRDAEREAREARRERQRLERELREARQQQAPDVEERVTEVRNEERARADRALAREALRTAAAQRQLAVSGDTVVSLVDLDSITVTDDGDVDRDAVSDALDELLEREPGLAATTSTGNGSAGTSTVETPGPSSRGQGRGARPPREQRIARFDELRKRGRTVG